MNTMDRPVIRVNSLSKKYVLGGEINRQETFREMLANLAKSPFRRLRRLQGLSPDQQEFWALKNISFEVKKGEVLGIIGANGAGKSTLLKILGRITAPTAGEIEYVGRIASLLEVGTGFHPELSGRENIYLNGAIIGMSKSEIRKRFDEIVDFAGVEKFLDTPVKRYSSGMYLRLAFAVAAHLDPDILLVDEILAVGDAEFQKKSLGKMKDVSASGRTVLFVSHNMSAISKLCEQGIFLDKGRLEFIGDVNSAINEYYKMASDQEKIGSEEFFGNLKPELEITRLDINEEKNRLSVSVSPSQAISINVYGTAKVNIGSYRTTVALRKDGYHVLSLHDKLKPEDLIEGDFVSKVEIPAFFLSPGLYVVEAGGYSKNSGKFIWARNLASITVINEWDEKYDTLSNMGLVNLPVEGERHNL